MKVQRAYRGIHKPLFSPILEDSDESVFSAIKPRKRTSEETGDGSKAVKKLFEDFQIEKKESPNEKVVSVLA